MNWYAVDSVEEAMDETDNLLMPFDLVQWGKLALVILLIGGGFSSISNVPTTGGDMDQEFGANTGFEALSSYSVTFMEGIPEFSPTGDFTASTSVIVLAVIVLFAVAMFFTYVSSLFRFSLYQMLRDKDVSVIKSLRPNYGKALRYLGFVIAQGILLIVALLPFGTAFLTEDPLIGFLLGLPFVIILLVLYGLVGIIASDFVIPRMIQTDKGLIQSFREVINAVFNDLAQFFVYVALKILIVIGISIAVGFIFIIGILVSLIVALPVIGVFFVISPLLAIIPGLIYLAIIIIFRLYLSVPFITFLYYYHLLVYEKLMDTEIILELEE